MKEINDKEREKYVQNFKKAFNPDGAALRIKELTERLISENERI